MYVYCIFTLQILTSFSRNYLTLQSNFSTTYVIIDLGSQWFVLLCFIVHVKQTVTGGIRIKSCFR